MKTSVLKFGMEHKGFLAACCRKWEKYKADRIERKFLKENPRRLSRQDSEKILTPDFSAPAAPFGRL